VLANAAFYYGALKSLAADERPVWTKMSFDAAHSNFTEGARRGTDATFYWPGIGAVPADELVLRRPLRHTCSCLTSLSLRVCIRTSKWRSCRPASWRT
jgi:hypothetical protein